MLITGASSGIGRATAVLAAAAGARLAVAARSQARLEELAHELGERYRAKVVPIPADITLEEDRQRLLQTAAGSLGGLDVLVNNAGVASFGHFSGNTEEVLRQVMEVNFFAPAELIRSAIPLL